jgi:hypothetical protein
MNGIRGLVSRVKGFARPYALITGHTDRQGSDAHNLALSRERAESMKAFLLEDAKDWLGRYKKKPGSSPWGTAEDQSMLRAVLQVDGTPFYDGEIDGDAASAKTRAALVAFQKARMLDPSGAVDEPTRLALIQGYMKIEGTSVKGAAIATHGCGPFHPTPGTAGAAEKDQPANRRVEVFLAGEPIAPPPVQPCPSGGCAGYASWVAQSSEEVDLDQPPGAVAGENVLVVQIPFDPTSEEGRRYRLVLTGDGGAYRVERSAAEHAERTEDGFDVTFAGLSIGQTYSLLVDGGSGANHYYLFQGLTYTGEEA